MTTNLTPPDELLITKLGINPSNLLADFPSNKLDQYIAVVNWLKKYKPKSGATNLEKVQGYLETFHHLCEVKDWKRAKTILDFRLDTPTDEEFHLQMGTWGYYEEQTKLYDCFLKNIEDLHPFYKIAFLLGKGSIEYAKGQYLKAIDYYSQAQLFLQLPQDEHQKGVILNNIGLAYLGLENFNEAKQHFWQRLIIAWKHQELEQEGVALNNLGLVYHEKKEYAKAIKYQKRSLSILRITANKLGEGSVLDSLASNYAALGKYSQALEYQEQRLKIAQEIEDRRGEAEAFCNGGITLAILKKYSEAIESFQKSIEICRTIGTRSIEAYAFTNMAILYVILVDPALALECCDRALSIATELGIPLAKQCQELKEKLLNEQTEPMAYQWQIPNSRRN